MSVAAATTAAAAVAATASLAAATCVTAKGGKVDECLWDSPIGKLFGVLMFALLAAILLGCVVLVMKSQGLG